MTNENVIREFKRGATKGMACHLYIKGNELINYSTVLAFRDENGGFHVNTRKYSSTTSKIQNYILSILADEIVEKYEGESCYYWNYGYVGAYRIKASEVY